MSETNPNEGCTKTQADDAARLAAMRWALTVLLYPSGGWEETVADAIAILKPACESESLGAEALKTARAEGFAAARGKAEKVCEAYADQFEASPDDYDAGKCAGSNECAERIRAMQDEGTE